MYTLQRTTIYLSLQDLDTANLRAIAWPSPKAHYCEKTTSYCYTSSVPSWYDMHSKVFQTIYFKCH